MTNDDRFGPEAHDRAVPHHSGAYGHYCREWDDLWICQDCSEFECCTCYPGVPYTGPISEPIPAEELEKIFGPTKGEPMDPTKLISTIERIAAARRTTVRPREGRDGSNPGVFL